MDVVGGVDVDVDVNVEKGGLDAEEGLVGGAKEGSRTWMKGWKSPIWVL